MALPIYNALIKDSEDGIFAVSLVEYPATEFNWLAFNKEDERKKLYFVNNEEQRIITSVLMVADTPLYRRQGDFEYYIVYDKETLKTMAEKVLMDNTLNNIDLEHNGEILEKGKVSARELFIKDTERGIDPKGMEEVPDGSLMCSYKVNDDEIWTNIKEGTWKGFSLAGLFTIEEHNEMNYKKNNKMSKIAQLKELLREILVEFSTIKTMNGQEIEVGSDELAEGVAIKCDNGEIIIEDGRKLIVKDGVIAGITDVDEAEEEKEEADTEEKAAEEAEEAAEEDEKEEIEASLEAIDEESKEEEQFEAENEVEVEEDVVEEPIEEIVEPKNAEIDDVKARIEAIEGRIAAFEAVVEEIRSMVNEIATQPAVEPIRDEFSPVEFNKWGLRKQK